MDKRNLSSWLEWIETCHPSEMELGLDRVTSVYTSMSSPKPANRIVTFAGTNGKGTTAKFVEAVLISLGYRVGTYSSPHLHIFNERIQINSQYVDDESIVDAFEFIQKNLNGIKLTYFEYTTLAAFYIFSKQNLDYALLEVGLGGRLDAVNIIDPDVSVITTINFDHCDWLGDTKEAIAKEKTGIFRTGKPAVCGDLDSLDIVQFYAEKKDVSLYAREQDFFVLDDENHPSAHGQRTWTWSGKGKNGQLIQYQNLGVPNVPRDNIATALQVLSLEGVYPQENIVRDLISKVSVPGRFQEVHHPFHCIFDVAHNPEAARLLAIRLSQKRKAEEVKEPAGKWYAVFSVLSDKNVSELTAFFSSMFDEWYLPYLGDEVLRALPTDQTVKQIQSVIQDFKYQSFDSMDSCLSRLKSQLEPLDTVVVFGSFYTVSQAQQFIQGGGQ